MKILISDQISMAGVNILRQHAEVDIKLGMTLEQMISVIGGYDALIVRSQSRITAEVIDAAKKLQVIARAGVGVDNIDIDAATRRGIIVINSPEGNIASTAEHTIAMLLSMARRIPYANSQLRAGIWDRSSKGIQVRNKILGIVGLGRVGTEVAELAKGLHMSVIAYDPMVSESRADRLGAKMVGLEELLAKADFITIHIPLNSTTKGLIGREQLKQMKPTAMVLNCARGGIIDEMALYQALEEGLLAGAAIDVFDREPAENNILLKSDKVVATPHLAASTNEAEESASIDIAEQVVAVLKGNLPKSPVNVPIITTEAISTIGPYIHVGRIIGKIAVQLVEGQLESLSILYQGAIAGEDTRPIKASILAGLLELLTEERVNMVSADFIANSRGIKVNEQKEITCENYSNLVTLEVKTQSASILVSGSSLRGKTHLIRVNDFWFEIEPTGSYMVFTEHMDRPGMIGGVGVILGNADINISQMQVSRGVQRGGGAMMVLCLDEPLTDQCYQHILALHDMNRIVTVRLI